MGSAQNLIWKHPRSNSIAMTHRYHERFTPWFIWITFWLPVFWNFTVQVSEADVLTFGYGLCGPLWPFKKSISLSKLEVQKSGFQSAKENCTMFGGWGIKCGGGIINYNPEYKGNYLQVKDTGNGRTYRFSCANPKELSDLLNSRMQA